MALVLGGALAALCLLVVSLPLLRKGRVLSGYPDPIREVQEQREAIYHEVRMLHSDYELGHVPETEYQERLQSHRLKAATLLQQQEQLQELDQRLEEEVLASRDDAGDVAN